MTTLYVLLSQPVTFEDLGVETIEELREAAEEFACNVFYLGSGMYLFTANRYESLLNLSNVHDYYRGAIVEVSKLYI